MISLKESWSTQRLKRQQEVGERQQNVHSKLMQLQNERSVKGAQVRQQLQQSRIERQQAVQTFMAQVAADRQMQADHLTHQLAQFIDRLRLTTAQLLDMHAANRACMAEQMMQDLGQFHAELSHLITELRQQFQLEITQIRHDVQTLQAETQLQLQIHHQKRLAARMQQIQRLTSYVNALHADVQASLAELELLRHDRAHQIHHRLEQAHERRQIEMARLFQQLAVFRGELRTFRADLSQQVWGKFAEPTPQPPKTKADPIPTVTPPARLRSIPPKATARPTVTTSAPVPILVSQPSIPSPQAAAEQLEKKIYQHIQHTQGARLTEIETTLSINRFQAVDALRSLIKKGLITQRDRVYLIQEEISL